MNQNKALLILLALFVPTLVWSASGEGVPVSAVISQIANLSILGALIYFTQRKNVSQFFIDKKKSYLDSVEQSLRFKKEAEAKFKEVSDRLAEIKNTFDQQVKEAQKNAEDSYRDQLAQAKNEAQRINKLALASVDFETQKQIESLRREAYSKSALQAKNKLAGQLSTEQQKAWNNHFVSASDGVH